MPGPTVCPAYPLVASLGLIGALALAVFALTGCFAVEMNATVGTDNTLSGTAKIGVSNSLAAIAGGPSGLLAEMRKSDPCSFGSKSGTPKDYDDGTFVGIECSFDKLSFADFDDGKDGPKISRDGDTFHLTGIFDAKSAVSSIGGSSSGSSSS